jgi:hypothetical protein
MLASYAIKVYSIHEPIMSKLTTAINIVERGLTSSQHPDFRQAQEAYVQGMLPAGIKRMAALALFRLASGYAGPVSKAYDLLLGSKKLPLAGTGFEVTAYRRDQEVVKVDQASIRMSEQEREQLRVQKEAYHSVLRQYLGSVVIDQRVVVDRSPIHPKQQAVQTIQPFCDFGSLELFKPDCEAVNPEAIASACRQFPGLESALEELVCNSRTLSSAGFLPDVNGFNNVVVGTIGEATAPELRLIDTTPIVVDSTSPAAWLITHQLDSLEKVLQDIAL